MKHNLLPKAEKKELRTEYIVRALNVCMFLLTFVVLLGASALVPAYIKANTDLAEIISLRDTEAQQDGGESSTAPEVTLQEATDLLAVLKSKIEKDPTTTIIDKVFLPRPQGISIEGLSFNRHEGNVVLQGTAANRDSLVLYRRALEEQPDIEQVTSPISNLAKNANLPFQLSFVFGRTASSTP